MRHISLFNDHWLFFPEQVDSSVPDSAFDPITLPHSNRNFPHNCFDDADYQFISTYRNRFVLPQPLQGRRVYIDFDGAMIAATVTINGHQFEEHKGGYTPFSYDITDYLNEDGENLLTVYLDSHDREDIPPYGGIVDYLTFGGIYRDVHLRYVDPCHIEKAFVRTLDVLTDHARIEVDVRLKNQSDRTRTFLTYCGFEYSEYAVSEASQTVELASGSTTKVTLRLSDGKYELWSPDNPRLYDLGVHLYDVGEEVDYFDLVAVDFGLRQAEFREDSFYLNGEKRKLIGLNRHQTYPYIGAAAPKRLQCKDADIIKYELGCNIVRTAHYPQSTHFLDRCDEIGLLVLEEIPGWQHIGDESWQTLSLRDVRAMIERDRNHPSIVMWGVRINESLDNEVFYAATNRLAHDLDPTRQTGGVRNSRSKQFQEDVFTFNDFAEGITVPQYTPYLITEFCGHMFPTKSWDHEERLVEHALKHARKQDLQMGHSQVAGAIGWCAFDYNTHKDFGSGDRVCYHGVMDIFRLPCILG